MSASQWSLCPKCDRERLAIFENLQRQVSELYGKVPVEEFDQARAHLEQERVGLESREHYTWREDFRFEGVRGGALHVRYRGGCTVCKLKLEFDEDYPVPGL